MVAAWDPEWLEVGLFLLAFFTIGYLDTNLGLKFAEKAGELPRLPEDPAQKKAACNGLLQQANDSQPPVEAEIITKDIQIPDGPIVRVYKPGDSEGPLPMILFIHGGGWFAGNLNTEDRTCRLVCSTIKAWIVSVDYHCDWDVTLEEEIEDCYKAYVWALGRIATHGIDTSKLLVWGGSCGGALAIATVYRIVKDAKPVTGLICMNTMSVHPDATPEKYRHLHTSMVDNDGEVPFVRAIDNTSLFKVRGIEPPNTNIDVFPVAFGPDSLRGFPPTYIVTSENDPGRDDGVVLEAELKDIGVPVKSDQIKGLAHYFWVFPLPKANARFWSLLCQGIQWVMAQ